MKKFQHNCEVCEYLGTITYPAPHRKDGKDYTEQKSADLYCCAGEIMGASIIARHGSNGSDYASCPASIIRTNYLKMNEFSTCGPALIAGYYFACAKGLIKNENKNSIQDSRCD